ncbi:BCL2/adenovirus E1B 19 kDa protein-interacting protein 3 isoform X1 [Neodiprion pinetum]|uniref:BCL2/adenovirus E1B 19 kDa protein-interacting protein 3 isoform X1 n=1 Tax=Neodiprion lecontei TaxID=441921 RepID=A0A6J0BHI9_NEOLC|nr:BCL2/adenovirus E1B 19 kDa protein-interacting protein 3 isoform X1 [Neodiprion lecontei]XP_046431211.1 BCL2/adenovirus E1B 19 kDa protein-interacting protein 3 isoform X1 [Neodiprion fabricii]XP_046488755.1 BCL2/adenovirus E1B 19 kDa protein-interacting protein 3 isoform X1 [Neodiprion pinetum]XP_046624983.1 BCL2/adenovirus E1B 19 kDa protein-interacting protein 3 isoform X1 [Neodiprion virginianus]
MSSTAKFTSDDLLGGAESWVELNPVPADRVTPLPFSSSGGGGEEYLRLLREAQRDSTQSSARHSLASSRRDTPRDSPKSPPNSPNTELSTEDEFKGVYINYSCNKDGELVDKNTDWIYEWSSRPDQAPPKDWKFKHPLGVTKRKTYSIRTAKVGKNGLFSKEVLYTLFLTNFLSLLIGTGFGVWLTRRGLMVPRITIE